MSKAAYMEEFPQEKKTSTRKVIISGMLGNGLEWYDYALYAQMITTLSVLFFPSENESVRLIAAFGVFAVGFVFRPVGALFFGYIGDKYGRRTSLVIAILMMAIPTGCIGILPTYEQIGIAAPILLTLIRIFQGMSLGGEFSGSITYMVEHGDQSKRGLIGSACVVSLIIGFLLGSFVALFFSSVLSHEDFMSFGWRIPFLIGIVIGFVGLYIRTHCHESPSYEEAKAEGHLSKKPLRDALISHKSEMLQAFVLYISVTMPFYLTSVYLLSFTEKKLGFSTSDSLLINTSAMFAMILTTIGSAYLSDKIGRKKILFISLITLLIVIYPLFLMLDTKLFAFVLLAQIILGLIVGCYIAPIPALLVEIFPTSVRYTGMAISYNLAACLFGGTAPMVCEWLINKTSSYNSIAFYVMLCNILSLIGLYFYKDRYKDPLRKV